MALHNTDQNGPPEESPGLPWDQEAEQATLGAILLEPGAATLALSMLEPSDFHMEAHEVLFRAMRKVAGRGDPVDLITVTAELRRINKLDAAGGAGYLTALIQTVPTAAHVTRYAQIVKDKGLLRQVIRFAAKAQADAYEDPDPQTFPDFLAGLVEGAQGLHDLACPPDDGNLSAADYGKTAREREYLWRPWLPKGEVIVVGGETGLGKSIFCLYLAAAATGQLPWPDNSAPPPPGLKVLWCDTEGREFSTWERIDEWGIDGAPIMFPGSDGIAAMSLDLGRPGAPEELAKRAAGEGCSMLVVDTLSAAWSGDENKASAISPVLKACKEAARKHDLAWLFTAHANKRGQLQGPEMTLDRLRGSGAIKQWAVSVIGIDQVKDGQEEPRRVSSLKLNYGHPPADLGWHFEKDSSFPKWGAPPEKPVIASVEDQAAQFLRDQLAGGPRLAAEVWEASRSVGLGERAVNRAKALLQVRVYQQGGAGKWWWQLSS